MFKCIEVTGGVCHETLLALHVREGARHGKYLEECAQTGSESTVSLQSLPFHEIASRLDTALPTAPGGVMKGIEKCAAAVGWTERPLCDSSSAVPKHQIRRLLLGDLVNYVLIEVESNNAGQT